VRPVGWRLTFGTAAGESALPTGIVPTAEAATLAARLAAPSVIELASLAGQRVEGGTRGERSALTDLEVVSTRHDPVVEVLDSGRHAEVRALRGAGLSVLSYRLSWVEAPEITERVVAESARVRPPETDADGKLVAPQRTGDGSRIAMQVDARWLWTPTGEAVLPRGSALVLCAEHPAGRAVIIAEELP